MKKALVMIIAGGGLILSGVTYAGKVNLPKEGPFEFDFCAIGQGKGFSSGENYVVSHYQNIANVTTNPPGQPFDRTAGTCMGVLFILDGKPQDTGMCELTDEDGDKWWLQYRGNADGSGGTYSAPFGTGKYEGMTIRGEYRLDFWPVASKEVAFQGCFHNKGTYKLK
jgi:hypothetical protein